MSTDTAVTKTQGQAPKKLTLAQVIATEGKKQFALALPTHCTPERFARVAITAINKNPVLGKCTQTSVISCLLQLSQLGLEPDGRRAHLIPFKNKVKDSNGKPTGEVEMICTLIVDYKGIVELALRSGLIATIHADVVYHGDLFIYSRGRVVEHVPHFLRTDAAKPAEASDKLWCVYAMVINKDGTEKAEVMSTSEIERIRRRSKSADDGPWKTDYDEMAKKTVFKRLSKWLVLSAEFRDAVEADDDVPVTIDVTSGPQLITEVADQYLNEEPQQEQQQQREPETTGQSGGQEQSDDGERRTPLTLDQVLGNISNATRVADVVDAAFGHDYLTPEELEVIQKAKRGRREELLRRAK